ncbi:hypothetical protein WJX74_008174 [Apatococcus lobatus]|uniref:PA14 domain-containing protein n=1 Tax=Apatococcus lobatus TaxID=904363 RepID=A0AAW1RLP2_9CHLO
MMAGGASAQVENPPLCATLGINATFWRKDGTLYAPDSPPYFDEYPFSMPPDPYLATRPSDEELVVSQVNFGFDSPRSGDWESWPADYNETYFVVVLESYIELSEGGEYTFYLSNSDQGELELSKDNVTQTAILGAAWSDYEEDHQGTTLILEYDLVPTRYLMRIKYHKASPIDAFGPPYLRLEWTRTDLGVNISASPTERELVPDNIFYLNSMCEGLETPPTPPVQAPGIAPAQAPYISPIPKASGYGSTSSSSYGGVAAAAPGPSAAFDSELAPETAPMGRGAPTRPQPKSPTPVGPAPKPRVLPRARGNNGEAPNTAPSGEAAPTMGVNPFGKPMHSAAAPGPSLDHFRKPKSTIPLPKPRPQVVPGVLPPPGTPGSYCPAPAIHYHISYSCCPNRGGAYGMAASPPMSSTDPDSPMSCGTHYDVVPVERGPPVPALQAPEAAPSRRRSMAEAQEDPEEGLFVIDVSGTQEASNTEGEANDEWVEDDRDGITIEESDRFEEEAEDEAEVMATMSRMAEQAQNEEAESQVAEILANDAKFWRDQASWEATGGLQSSGEARLAQQQVAATADASTQVTPIMDSWSTTLFGTPAGKSVEDARTAADQSNNHSSLWSYLLHYREAGLKEYKGLGKLQRDSLYISRRQNKQCQLKQ